ncbi:MAG: PepSY-like domain-containing protein [Planctomycetota bacterium]
MRHALPIRPVLPVLALALVATLALADADTDSLWDIDDARIATKIEIQVDKAGNVLEAEFHVDPQVVPAAVRAAMEKLHPGGTFTDAEIERQDGVLYYELTSTSDGRESEAMFLPDGTLHSEENEVGESEVPEAVRAAIKAAFADGQATKWEEIRDEERQLVEYHVKLTRGGRKIKAMVTTKGVLRGAVLEVPAEIEVPISLR